MKPEQNIGVIGVGGCGLHFINYLSNMCRQDFYMAAVDTDGQTLENCAADVKYLVKKDRFRLCADAEEHLAEMMRGLDVVYIMGGAGGRTGSKLLPVLAELADRIDNGLKVIAVLCHPFQFEQKDRINRAKAVEEEIWVYADEVIVFENDEIMAIVPKETLMPKVLEKGNGMILEKIRASLKGEVEGVKR